MLRSRSHSSSTPNSSPTSSPSKKHRLSIAGVTSLFVKIRRLEEKAVSADDLELTSGDPKTHPNVAESAKDQGKILVEQTDLFVCAGGVNLPTLLRITRIALMEHVERQLGANSVVNERWECTISGQKPVHARTYKVQIRYSASATMSSVPDCRRPVALDQATSIPGLMSILKRNDL
ncbi:hypothetical protein BYT27DRAFT_7113345 [Phlegmacium glaucopus]|nr:hypothetical protein BYT27DRAFT_7113345 [Phlegmacium glaucopus]